MRYTQEQVKEQQNRFDDLLNKIDLVKFGRVFLKLRVRDTKNKTYNAYNFLRKYLKNHNIENSMLHPINKNYYGEILENKSIQAFFKSL